MYVCMYVCIYYAETLNCFFTNIQSNLIPEIGRLIYSDVKQCAPRVVEMFSVSYVSKQKIGGRLFSPYPGI